MVLRCALFGHPVVHSPSPLLHRLFAQATGCDLSYATRDVPPGGLAAALEQFRNEGGSGGNVTLPLKEEAFALCSEVSERARDCGAVNTLVWRDGLWLGDNTDGAGFIRDLAVNLAISVTGKRVLVAGAGGAARGITGPLLQHEPAALVMANRTPKRAREVAARFEHVTTSDYETLAHRGPFDIVINATSMGHRGQAPPLPDNILAEVACCYDLSYGSTAAPFMDWARRQGASRVYDGVGMLVEQAAESFLQWTGKHPATAPVMDAVRSAVS